MVEIKTPETKTKISFTTQLGDKSADNAVQAFQEAFRNKDMFFQFLDALPIAIEIFAPDGLAVFANRTSCNDMNAPDASELIGRYNILHDPIVNDVLGLREDVKRAFNGEVSTAYEVRVPYEHITTRYTQKNENFMAIKFQKISAFPLWDENKQLAYVAMIFETTHTYQGRAEIVRAWEYMDKHWLEEYDAEKIAQTVGLSSQHLSRLFKQYTNEKPFDYYKRNKVNKLKEKLLDPNLSVLQAFYDCGVDYNGKYKQYFKEIIGMTPSKFREEKFKTE